jgi:glycogen synthase
MRILFISNFYPPYEIGGYEQWCAEIASQLASRGHEIEILTSNYRVGPELNGIVAKISRVLYLESHLSYYRPLDFFQSRMAHEKSNIQMLRRKIDRFQPDIIMVWGMWNLSPYLPYWAEQWMPRRVAYFISNYWPMDIDAHTAYWQLPARHTLMEVIKRPLRKIALSQLRSENYPPQLQLANAVCCSHYVRNVPPSSGVLLGGIDPQPFLDSSKLKKDDALSRPGRLNLVYFGRLIRDKGVHTAIEALGLLRQRGIAESVHLTILGSGHPEYEAYLRTMATSLGVEQEIEFVRQVPRPEIPSWLSRFDVFLFTSIWPEPMARSVMEAMAAELLVLGTPVGGQAEMLTNGVNALTFKPDNAPELADLIARVRNDWALRTQLACAGQKLILERYTLDRMATDIENYLYSIQANHGSLI